MGVLTVLRYLVENPEVRIIGDPKTEEEYTTCVEWHGEGNKPQWEVVFAAWEAAHNVEAFNNLRYVRNSKLSACDWTQMPDVNVDKTAWAEYRQALRDLPENTIDPENPIWPTRPDEGGE